MPARPAAPHFTRALPAFLGELEKHNERAWFEAHREAVADAQSGRALRKALARAEQIPGARIGSVEVRPVEWMRVGEV